MMYYALRAQTLSEAYLDQEQLTKGSRQTSPMLLFKGILQATCSLPEALSDMVCFPLQLQKCCAMLAERHF